MRSEERYGNGQMVLIVAQSAAFAQSLVARWKQEPSVPAFTVMTPGSNGIDGKGAGYYAACHLAIVESSALPPHRAMLQRLDVVGVPMICAAIHKDGHSNKRILQLEQVGPAMDRLRPDFPRALPLSLPQGEEGIATLVVVAAEVLRRVDATIRAKMAESLIEPQAAQLALGKYVADSMHGFNNAMTAVLGNAELLMLDSGDLPPQMQEQIEAIHSNSLRLHEMMQRFSSLEAEMNAGKKQGQGESAMAASQAYLSGT